MYDGASAMTMNPPVTAQRPAAPRERALNRPSVTAVPGRSQRRIAAPGERALNRPSVTTAAPVLRPGAVLLFAGAMAVLLFIVYSYMQLSELSNQNQRASAELHMLIKEEGLLNRQIEASVSLSEVAAYAEAELGMVKPAFEQIVYIGTVAEDHAEIIPQQGFWGNVRQLFSTMTTRAVEFFD